MSLLNKASLIQIPSGYKDGTLYSAKPTNGDGDFTFSRGSNLAATRVNSEGLIEKGRENFFLRSNEFDNASWGKYNVSVTTGQADKDGGTDAFKITKTDVNGRIYQSISQTGVNTTSVYAKAGDSTYLRFYAAGPNANVYFNLSDGTFHSGSSYIDYDIQSVGNGWYRCSITFSGGATIRIYPAEDNTTSGSSGSIYIQDAQAESGLVATEYIETGASTAQAGILEDMPRLDYSGGATCPSLLLEPQRSNLFEHSEYFGSSDWSKGNVLLTTNSSQSPEGVNNATLMYPTATPSGFAYLYNTTSGSSARYTISAFVKADGKDVCWLYIQGVSAYGIVYFDLSDESIQVVAGSSSTPTGTIEEVNNGWYRITFTLGEDLAISSGSGIGVSDAKGSTSVTQNGEDGILVYGLQIESGSYATSYIPTYGASVTRGADAASDSNVTPTSNKATLFIEISGDDDSYSRNVCAFRNGTTNQYGLYFWGTDNNKFGFNSWQADAYGITNSTIFDGNIHKIAAVFDFTDFTTNTLFIDGVKQSISQVKGTTIQRTANKVSLIASQSNQNPRQNLHQFICFDSGLSDDECIQLTTI